MQRRAFLHAGLGAAAIGAMMPWADCYGALSESNGQVLVVIDPALPASGAYAAVSSARMRLRLEAGADIGILWHARLRDWRGEIRGVVRRSDCFVLRNLSVAQGRAFRSTPIGPNLEDRAGGAESGRRSRRTTSVVFDIAAIASCSRNAL